MNILKILTPLRRTGNFGEAEAAKYLKHKGYKILERNYVALDSEIDIIARYKDVTVFVEVKTRTLGTQNPSEPRPASAVTPEKQRNLIKAAKCYLTLNGVKSRSRFDIIEVLLDGVRSKVAEIRHLENTFNLNTAYRRHI